VALDSLPLGEVLKLLNEESVKHDPEKIGINFLINPNAPLVTLTGTIDPTTGLPVAAPAAEAPDMSAVMIKFNLPLRHVTMKGVLDAIVKVADHPIEYSIEDYAVVFSARGLLEVGGQPAAVARHAAVRPESEFAPRQMGVTGSPYPAPQRAPGSRPDPSSRSPKTNDAPAKPNF